MTEQEVRGLILGVASIIASMLIALAPIGPFVSDEPLPAVPNLVITDGVVMPGVSWWYYFWKVTIILVVLFFASLIASFFVESRRGMRVFFAVLSFAIAVFHYANVLTMTNSISIYPFLYAIYLNINGLVIKQYYLDIGQLFFIYGFYNVYLLLKK